MSGRLEGVGWGRRREHQSVSGRSVRSQDYPLRGERCLTCEPKRSYGTESVPVPRYPSIHQDETSVDGWGLPQTGPSPTRTPFDSDDDMRMKTTRVNPLHLTVGPGDP